MKKVVFAVIILFYGSFLMAQNVSEAEKLVEYGVALHDKGDYLGALSKYNEALVADKDNLSALAEKAYSYMALERFEDVIETCQLAVEKHKGDENLKSVFVTYGTACDYLKKTEKAIEIYDEGIKLFPGYYMLHFNKGISLAGLEKLDEAILEFQQSLKSNPKHPGSHNALATMLMYKKNKIASILAFSRFLILEPTGKRAVSNLKNVNRLLTGNAEKTGKKSITINLDPSLLSDTTDDGKQKNDNFATIELIMVMTSALDFDKKNSKKSEVERFMDKANMIFGSLNDPENEHTGFYWKYYAPYFAELKDKGHVETFAYIIFATSEDKKVGKWIKKHPKEIEAFYKWSESFEWANI